MGTINKGSKVLYQQKVCSVLKVLNIDKFLITLPDKSKIEVKITDLESLPTISGFDLESIKEEDWLEAKRRLDIIQPLLILKKRKEADVIKVANKNNIGQASIYRWLKSYESSQKLLTSLLPKERTGGRGESRIDNETDQIINETIHKYYLTSLQRSITKTHVEISRICFNKNIPCPSLGTVRNRINAFSERIRIEKRHGKQVGNNKFEPKISTIPGATHPLALVQIDHTKLDIIVVDQYTRKPIGRPWLALAIDVYSRMVVGYYLSFESPSVLNTGICIANSMSSKDSKLLQFNVDAEWPCWGKIDTIHTDNGKDFRSNAIKRSCEQYGINLEFRPLGMPHFGGHIERLLGTILKELHAIPGTTFNSIEKRKNYNSSKNAILTLDELDKWILTYFTKIYHLRIHSSLGTSPLMMFKEGLLGSEEIEGIGIPERINDEKKLYLDFLPTFERTIQDYGVVIDHIYYYSDVLRPFINAVEKPYVNASRQKKKEFIFRRDPRDISKIYFFDQELNKYFEIPYRNMSYPSISLWEVKAAIKRLKINQNNIDEATIFSAYNSIREIEENAAKAKRSIKSKPKSKTPFIDEQLKNEEEKSFEQIDFDNIKILPIDDE